MPFTFSHPALVLPLNYLPKKWVSITALVVGSMMPDLEAFLRFQSEKGESHTWDALVWFCLPLGLIICLLFHQIVKTPFLFNLPPFLKNRLITYTQYNWLAYFKNNVLVVLICLLMGGASHLVWDSFTHYEGVLLKLNPGWDRNTTVWGYSIEIVYVIQYANSILGLLIILFAILQLPVKKQTHLPKGSLAYWMLLLLITSVIFTGRWFMMDQFKIDDVIVSGLMALVMGIGFSSLIFYKKYKLVNNVKIP